MKKLILAALFVGLVSLLLAGCGGAYSRAGFEQQRLHFALDKYDLNPQDIAILDQQIAFLKHYPGEQVMIVGHCDDRASDKYNLELGRNRAEEAERYMLASGINPRRIKTLTTGKRNLDPPGTSEPARAENRRGIFIFTTNPLTTGNVD